MTSSRRNTGDEFTPKNAFERIIKEIRRRTLEWSRKRYLDMDFLKGQKLEEQLEAASA